MLLPRPSFAVILLRGGCAALQVHRAHRYLWPFRMLDGTTRNRQVILSATAAGV